MTIPPHTVKYTTLTVIAIITMTHITSIILIIIT